MDLPEPYPSIPGAQRGCAGSLCSTGHFRTGTALPSRAWEEPLVILLWGHPLFPSLLPHIVKPLVESLPPLEPLLTQRQPPGIPWSPTSFTPLQPALGSTTPPAAPQGFLPRAERQGPQSLQGHLPSYGLRSVTPLYNSTWMENPVPPRTDSQIQHFLQHFSPKASFGSAKQPKLVYT